MDLVSIDMRSPARLQTSTARIQTLIDHWHNRHEKWVKYGTKEVVASPGAKGELELEERPEKTPMWVALPVVLDRMMRNAWRQPDLFWTR